MKKLILIAALFVIYAMPAMAITCSAGTHQQCTSGSGRGGGYHSTCVCVANGCTTPWGTAIASGSLYQAFQSATVVYPDVCVSETVTCSYGQLSPNLGYTNPSCTQTVPSTGGTGGTGGKHHQQESDD